MRYYFDKFFVILGVTSVVLCVIITRSSTEKAQSISEKIFVTFYYLQTTNKISNK